MNAKVFVDTNILVYAHDAAAGEKHETAKALVEELWRGKSGVLSTQVLEEFYVTVRKKVLHPEDADTARRWVSHYVNWRVIANDHVAVLSAIDIEQRFRVSFWDAMIIQAANTAKVALLYSEDLNHDQVYAEVRVENPFSN